MRQRAMSAARGALAAALVVALCVGCIYVSKREAVTSASWVKGPAMGRIEPGASTRADVVAALGQPAEVEPLPDGGEVMVYKGHEQEKVEKRVLFVMHSHSQETRLWRLYVTLDGDGVVTDRRLVEVSGGGATAP